jgi:acyl-homoserine lactone acylase PvdQ
MVVQELKTKFGTWEIPWGDINRFQRLSGDINLDYDDSIASLPISAASFGLLTRLQKCLSRKHKEKVW